MPTPPHHAVQTVHERATTVVSHTSDSASGSFWRRWFDKPNERQFADEVRAFVVALDYLLDVPPTMVSRHDLTAIGEDVQQVVKRIETEIEPTGGSSAEVAASLAPAIYVIRARHEELYRRGASRED
jgi:hypothetical protein